MVWILILALLLTGCGTEVEPPVIETTIPITTVAEPTQAPTPQEQSYEVGDTIPILVDGINVGTVLVNSIEYLPFSDWSKVDVIRNRVSYSYAVNISIDSTLSHVRCNLYLASEGKNVSEEGYVGWSGYNRYPIGDGTPFEVVLQPLQDGADELVMQISGREGDSQIIHIPLAVTSEHQDILGDRDTLEIVSANGAVYTVAIHDVWIEDHYSSSKVNYRDTFVTFSYTIHYVSGPTNDIVVSNFTTNGELLSSLFVGVQLENSSTIYSDNVVEARRNKYSDDNTLETYVTTEYPTLAVGERFTAVQNRLVSSECSTVRFFLEFPSEARASDVFPKYQVFELSVEERPVKSWRDDVGN